MNYSPSELLVESLNTIGNTFAEKSGIQLIRDYLSHPDPDEAQAWTLKVTYSWIATVAGLLLAGWQ